MKHRLRLAVSGVLLLIVSAQAAEYSIHAEVWARPRSGDALLALPALQDLLHDFDANPQAAIEIRYPGGEEGVLWAQELKDWLVALGVPSRRIEVVVGSGVQDSIRLLLNKRAAQK
ncbi:MAG: hypothetical protein OEN20_03700 [Gammaproteobacteria bacterium]|nr:hypothetical protein [Gammaproteobacteria bacterium]